MSALLLFVVVTAVSAGATGGEDNFADPARWQSYSNDRYGYEIRYPAGFEAWPTGPADSRDGRSLRIMRGEYAAPIPVLDLRIVAPGEDSTSRGDAMHEEMELTRQDVTIDGTPVTERTHRWKSSGEVAFVDYRFADVRIELHASPGTQEVRETVWWKIVSTFRRAGVRSYGSLRAMMHEGETGTQVALESLLPDPELYGVGALSELAGEITILGGRVYLSYPGGESGSRTEAATISAAGAALLVTGRVAEWRSVTTRNSIEFVRLDEAIAELARAAGVDVDRRFPFLVEGELAELQWHVIDGSKLTAGGSSHQDHQAASARSRRDRVRATLVGFYSAGDQGVFTHMGSRTHLHCVLEQPLSSGHVDHVVLPAGTTVRFPAVLATTRVGR